MSSVNEYRELIRQAWAKYDAGVSTETALKNKLEYYVDMIEKEDANLAKVLRRQYDLEN